jgi:hypothetical protein
MKWLDFGNRGASAFGIAIRLNPVATRLPRGVALDIQQEQNDGRAPQ